MADRHTTRDFEVGKHRQIREHALRHHAYIRPDIGSGDQHETLAGIHQIPDDLRYFGAELLYQGWFDIELDHFAFNIPPQGLMQGRFPALSEPEDLQDAILGEIRTDLLGHPGADVFRDLLAPVNVRSNLGYGLQNEVQIAN